MITVRAEARKGAILPSYQTSGAAGADVTACLDSPAELLPGCRMLVPTGLSFESPEGYEIQVRPRSGLAARHGVTVLNAPGTIDSDYRGEVKVLLVNLGQLPYVIKPGDRIAQLVLSPVARASFVPSSSLSGTERGGGGFGSTGV